MPNSEGDMCLIDIVFILDSSESAKNQLFDLQKNFVENITDRIFEMKPVKSRTYNVKLAGMQFSSTVSIDHPFTAWKNVQNFKQKINSLGLIGHGVLFALMQHLNNQANTRFFRHVAEFSRISRQLRLLDVWKSDWELQICMKATLAFHSEYKIWLNYEKAVSGNTDTCLGSFSVREGSHVLRTALYLCNLYLVLYLFTVFPEFHLFIYVK